MNSRYRMPDKWKEQEAQKLKGRFAKYSNRTERSQRRKRSFAWVLLLALIVVAWWKLKR